MTKVSQLLELIQTNFKRSDTGLFINTAYIYGKGVQQLSIGTPINILMNI